MPIFLPHMIEPFGYDKKQWKAYFEQESAALDYIHAYSDTVGVFSLFSPKKRKVLSDARDNYEEKKKLYLNSL